jgi:hypothetical protein
MDPKSNQNGTNNQPKIGCLRFLGVLEEDVFSRFLETKKIDPKSEQIRKKHRGGTVTSKIARPGGMRGASREVRSGVEPLRVRQESGQEFKT